MGTISKNSLKKTIAGVFILLLLWLLFGLFIAFTRQQKTLYECTGNWESKVPPIIIDIPEKHWTPTDVQVQIKTDQGTIDAYLLAGQGECFFYKRTRLAKDNIRTADDILLKTTYRIRNDAIELIIIEDKLFGNVFEKITLFPNSQTINEEILGAEENSISFHSSLLE